MQKYDRFEFARFLCFFELPPLLSSVAYNSKHETKGIDRATQNSRSFVRRRRSFTVEGRRKERVEAGSAGGHTPTTTRGNDKGYYDD